MRAVVSAVWLFLLFPSAGLPASHGQGPQRRGPEPGWSTFVQGGYVHQLETGLDGGGDFSTHRFFLQAGPAFMKDVRRTVTLSLGYGLDVYDFSGGEGIASPKPWRDIHGFRVGLPVRWGVEENWTVFVIPSLRFTAEDGGDFREAMTGGGFVGCSYRFGDGLTLGPGIGVVTQIEDRVSIFPVLIIDWKITNRLTLGTGRGLGATLGPGLTLSWKASRRWKLALGGRFDKLRFRLREDGPVPGGVGEDRSFPLFGGVAGRYGPAQVSLLGGVALGGQLRLEEEGGDLVEQDDYPPAGFFGLAFRVRL